MKNIQNSLLVAAILMILNCSNSLGQSAQNKEPNVITTKKNTPDDASRNIIIHHLNSFQENDLEAVVSDYTNESVLITQDSIYRGPKEIKVFFTGLMTHFPKQKSNFQLDKMTVNNGLIYIVWHAKTPSLDVSLGSDTFVLKGGKIYQQTYVGQMTFIN